MLKIFGCIFDSKITLEYEIAYNIFKGIKEGPMPMVRGRGCL